MYAQEISAARFAELCLGVVVSETSSYYTHARTRARTHTHTHTSLTTFLFTQPSLHMRRRHEPRTTYVCWVLFQYTNMRYHFQYVFHDGNQEFLHCISLLPQGKSKTGIFQQLSKNA
jgi:hypothetical protein